MKQRNHKGCAASHTSLEAVGGVNTTLLQIRSGVKMLIDVTKTIEREDEIKECCKIFGPVVFRVYKGHAESFTMRKTGNHQQYVRLRIVKKMILCRSLILSYSEQNDYEELSYYLPCGLLDKRVLLERDRDYRDNCND